MWRLCRFELVLGFLFLCGSEAVNLASPIFVGAIMYVARADQALPRGWALVVVCGVWWCLVAVCWWLCVVCCVFHVWWLWWGVSGWCGVGRGMQLRGGEGDAAAGPSLGAECAACG